MELPEGLAPLLAQRVRGLLTEKAVDAKEPTRMWLIDRAPGAASVFLTECHPITRLMRSPAAMSFATPPGRELIGVAWYEAALTIPSPDEVNVAAQANLSSGDVLPRIDRWRWQRILRQLPRARERRGRWPEFVMRNRLTTTTAEQIGVILADHNRTAIDALDGIALTAAAADSFWAASPFTPFGEAVDQAEPPAS